MPGKATHTGEAADREHRGGAQGRARLRDVLRIDVPALHAAITNDGVDASPVAKLLLRALDEHRPRYETRVLYCPPLPLLWGFSGGEGSAASVVHRAYVRAVWRERGLGGRLGLIGFFLLWPGIVSVAAAWFTWLNGPAVRTRTGKGIVRQLIEQIHLAAAHAILPPWYYMFELYDDAKRAQAGHYLRRDETKGGLFRLLRSAEQPKRLINNKLRFAERCWEQGVATPPLFSARRGRLRALGGGEPTLPRADLFVKPRKGRGGRGMEIWRYDGSGWSLRGARPLTEAELRKHLEQISQLEGYVVQPRLVNHPDLVDAGSGVLSTVRVLTCRDERGGYEVTNAAFRMPIGPEADVDNFHAGGIAARVNLSTGELGPATDMGLRPDSLWHERHPHSGAPIRGRVLPFWVETLELARRAHAAFPAWTVIGWDIAIVEGGPSVIEGNSGPDLDIIQRTHGEPLGTSRFGELLAFQIERGLGSERAASAPPRSDRSTRKSAR